MTTSSATVYVILGSHACRAGTLMFEHKRVPFRRVVVPSGLQRAVTGMLGFPGRTVPAVIHGDRRIQTNRAIARFLDEVRPDPPLFPADPERRRAVEEAERWADEEFQMVARRIALASALHGPGAMSDDGRLGPVLWRNPRVRRAGMRMVGRFVFNVHPRSEARLLAELPRLLDRIDAWIAAGVLGGEALNAADFAIASSVALLAYRPDLRADIEARPVGALVERILPEPPARG